MPIIIWGSRSETKKLESGRFYCPECDAARDYLVKETQPYFTLFFIPVFPTGELKRYVECQSCGGTFVEEVLQPPPAADAMIGQLWSELHAGLCLEAAEYRLTTLGLRQAQAEALIEQLIGKDVWTCDGCQRRYVILVKRCRVCSHE